MGGEWEEETLIKYLQLARGAGYKAALYTGGNMAHSIAGARSSGMRGVDILAL